MAIVQRPQTSFKTVPLNNVTYEMHVWVCSKGSVRWLILSRLECHRGMVYRIWLGVLEKKVRYSRMGMNRVRQSNTEVITETTS